MAELTLQQVFGPNATQTSTQLVISKADLTGLTASASNTAESLLVGLLLLWKGSLTETAQATNPDQSIRVTESDVTIATDFNNNNQQYFEKPFTVTLRKIFAGLTIDPDDY